jgi:hypothetical protein
MLDPNFKELRLFLKLLQSSFIGRLAIKITLNNFTPYTKAQLRKYFNSLKVK